MKPVYQDDNCTVFQGDCRELIPEIEFDVVVTDPPYGMNYQSNFSKSGPTEKIIGDDSVDLRDEVIEMCREKPMLVFGTWRMPRPDSIRELLVWNKTEVGFLGDVNLPWGPCHEEIYVMGEGWTGKRRSNVYSCKGLSASSRERPDHPTPKPVPLMRQLLEYCPSGVILDPFMGSGATLRAAKDLNLQCIGIEINEKYIEMAIRRLRQEVLPI